MSTITVRILRSDIYHIAEGISVSISQHNGGVPSFEQLWASADEARKLDIYYREAISDLERRLTEWIVNTSEQFDLTADGNNYTLRAKMHPYWPSKLQGLLTNKIQDYLVHAVTAGWLNDFAGLEIKQDYQTIATQDLSDIRAIICKREFNLATGFRREDNVVIASNDETPPYCREKNLRHRDNAVVDTHGDYTDWSGTDMSALVKFEHGCCPPPIRPHDPRIPDNPTHPNYPPIHTDGVDWSDKDFPHLKPLCEHD